MQPGLLLLDEVTSALDPELVAEVLEVVRELAAEGMTMLIATHEMSFARDVAHRVCFLDAGVILEQGSPEQIFGAPREPARSSSCSGSSTPDGCRTRGCARACSTIVRPMIEESRSIDVTLEPLDEFVVVQPISDETETRAGLILPASAAEAAPCRTGIVTAVGADAIGVDAGDKVLYPREAGYDVRLGGIDVKVLKREELIARIHD